MGLDQGLVDSRIMPFSSISVICRSDSSRWAKGMRRGCCLIGVLFPVLISCVKMLVCPKCSSKTSENSSSKFVNLSLDQGLVDSRSMPFSIVSVIYRSDFSRWAKGMRRGCCLIGVLFPVLISCVKMLVCPKCSSKTSENSSSKFVNLSLDQGLVDSRIMPFSSVSVIYRSDSSRWAKGMRRGCCLIGVLFPVLISCVKMLVCPKCSSKTSENSSRKFVNLPLSSPCNDGSIINSILSEITCGVALFPTAAQTWG